MLEDKYRPDIAVPPGLTLLETIEAMKMSQIELANRTGLANKTINEIIKGKSPITHETAIKLERVLGISASFWNNLEKNYREILAAIEAREQLEHEKELLAKFTCYKDLARYGVVKQTQDWRVKINELLRFFSVSSLSYVSDTEEIAFRIALNDKLSKECLAVWLRWGENEAKSIETPPFNREKLIQSLPKLKGLTTSPARSWSFETREILRSCGVVLVFTPYLRSTYVDGATRWLEPDKALIQLSARNKYLDNLWFTFFHELAHILKHGKKERFIELEEPTNLNIDKEKEANEFACNIMIRPSDYSNFISHSDFSIRSIQKFSQAINVNQGIVAGRMAHDGLIDWKVANHLRERVEIMPTGTSS